jgi:hypothetical protein
MKITLLALVLASMAAFVGGCDENKAVSNDEVRGWMRDDLATNYETTEEVRNRFTHTAIINGRKFNADIMRFFLVDHASRDISAPTIGTFE